MNEQRRPVPDARFISALRKSIFPTFNVNAPMPEGTREPPQVVVGPGPSQEGSASAPPPSGPQGIGR